jgi:hypothetical protein
MSELNIDGVSRVFEIVTKNEPSDSFFGNLFSEKQSVKYSAPLNYPQYTHAYYLEQFLLVKEQLTSFAGKEMKIAEAIDSPMFFSEVEKMLVSELLKGDNIELTHRLLRNIEIFGISNRFEALLGRLTVTIDPQMLKIIRGRIYYTVCELSTLYKVVPVTNFKKKEVRYQVECPILLELIEMYPYLWLFYMLVILLDE